MRATPLITRRIPFIAAALACCFTFASCAAALPDLPDGLYASLDTTKGRIIFRLETELAPMTVMNFVGLAEGTIDNSHAPGEPYFDGLTFHRVEPGFVIQGGDPNGDGRGGPGYQFPNETSAELLHDGPGIVAMANSGPDTNGSQFYITMSATPHLDGGYNVFGEVVEGMEVVSAIEPGDAMRSVDILRIGDEAESYVADENEFADMIAAIFEARQAVIEEARQAALDSVVSRYPGMTEDPENGLLFASLNGSGGTPPAAGDRVRVHIVFRLIDGTQIDSTRDRGEPEEFVYLRDRVLEGLELAIGRMGVGETAIAVIPPDLAFGATGLQNVVPANSYVQFELERLQ